MTAETVLPLAVSMIETSAAAWSVSLRPAGRWFATIRTEPSFDKSALIG